MSEQPTTLSKLRQAVLDLPTYQQVDVERRPSTTVYYNAEQVQELIAENIVTALTAQPDVEAGILREAERVLFLDEDPDFVAAAPRLIRKLVSEVQRLRAEQEFEQQQRLSYSRYITELEARTQAAESRLTSLVEGLRLIEQEMSPIAVSVVQEWRANLGALRDAASQP